MQANVSAERATPLSNHCNACKQETDILIDVRFGTQHVTVITLCNECLAETVSVITRRALKLS